MRRSHVVCNLAEDLLDNLRLHAQQNKLCLADGFPVRQRNFHSQLLLDEIQPFTMSGSGNELILLYDARVHHAGDQRFTELARSDYGYLGLG